MLVSFIRCDFSNIPLKSIKKNFKYFFLQKWKHFKCNLNVLMQKIMLFCFLKNSIKLKRRKKLDIHWKIL